MNDTPPRQTRTRSPWPPALVAVALLAVFVWTLLKQRQNTLEGARQESARIAAEASARDERNTAAQASRAERAAARAAAVQALKKKLLGRINHEKARANEAMLTFKDAGAYRRFLARAEAAGFSVIGRSDALHSVRIRYGDIDGLANDIFDNAEDYAEAGGNYIAEIPQVPELDPRTARNQVPVRNRLLETLGVAGADNSQWGRGVTIAVLDSGVLADPTFGSGRLRTLDIGMGVRVGQGGQDGHGTAVASLAAGAADDAPGVAPSANILSIRVTDESGVSDMFTIAQAIVAAADAGAHIINVSLGGYGGSVLLTRAIEYAAGLGAVVVAAAGNDQAAQLAWPAADKGAISVGATDALQQQVVFSNSGWQLQITAPGYGVLAAWTDGERIYFSGTSASAPVVAGAIAALMSQTPGMTAQQAWAVLQAYADDAGPQGRDNDYGAGVVDLDWAMDRSDTTRVDTAITSYNYDAKAGAVEVVVQNRSGFGMAGATLTVDVNGSISTHTLPWLDPAQTAVVKVPVNMGSGSAIIRSTLSNPGDLVDKKPENNQRASVLILPAK